MNVIAPNVHTTRINRAKLLIFFTPNISQTARVVSGVRRRRPLLGKKLGPSAFVTSKEAFTNISISLGPMAHSMERISSLIAGLEPRLRRMWQVKALLAEVIQE